MIPEPVYEFENPYKIEPEKYSRGGEFIENLVTDNTIECCRRWFNLAGFEDMLNDIDTYYKERNMFSNFANAGLVDNSPVVATLTQKQVPIEFTNITRETPVRFVNVIDSEIRKGLVEKWK